MDWGRNFGNLRALGFILRADDISNQNANFVLRYSIGIGKSSKRIVNSWKANLFSIYDLHEIATFFFLAVMSTF